MVLTLPNGFRAMLESFWSYCNHKEPSKHFCIGN